MRAMPVPGARRNPSKMTRKIESKDEERGNSISDVSGVRFEFYIGNFKKITKYALRGRIGEDILMCSTSFRGFDSV